MEKFLNHANVPNIYIILEWVAISLSRVSSWLTDGTQVSCIAGTFFTTSEPLGKPSLLAENMVFLNFVALPQWPNQSSLDFCLSNLSFWRRQWHPTPVLLPGKSHGLRSLVGRSPRVGHDWATSLSLFTSMHWRRKWQPTPVFLPGESQGRGSLVGCRLWGRTESDTTEAT